MLQKAIQWKGLDINACYKVNSVVIVEMGSDEQGKFYNVGVQVNVYTDETKQYDIEQKNYTFFNIRENQFTLTDCYNGLKMLPEFEGAIDC